MASFSIMSVLLLVNLLVAMFNSSYEKVKGEVRNLPATS